MRRNPQARIIRACRRRPTARSSPCPMSLSARSLLAKSLNDPPRWFANWSTTRWTPAPARSPCGCWPVGFAASASRTTDAASRPSNWCSRCNATPPARSAACTTWRPWRRWGFAAKPWQRSRRSPISALPAAQPKRRSRRSWMRAAASYNQPPGFKVRQSKCANCFSRPQRGVSFSRPTPPNWRTAWKRFAAMPCRVLRSASPSGMKASWSSSGAGPARSSAWPMYWAPTSSLAAGTQCWTRRAPQHSCPQRDQQCVSGAASACPMPRAPAPTSSTPMSMGASSATG